MPTFRAWATDYLNLEAVTGLRSFRDRKQILPVNRLCEHFGDKLLTDITPQDVEEYRKLRLNAGRTLATVNYDHAVLKHVLGIAERRGLIQSVIRLRKSRDTEPSE